MTAVNKESWIEIGYEIFALYGQGELKIERIAKKVGISKSSFYHHFADHDLFMEHLLTHHISQSRIIAEKERHVKNVTPELVNVLIEHKTDLLFNRQLRINRNNKLYNETLSKSNKIVGDAFIHVWIKELNLKLTKTKIDGIFELALENFYLQINNDNLNFDWLSEYFNNFKKIANSLV